MVFPGRTVNKQTGDCAVHLEAYVMGKWLSSIFLHMCFGAIGPWIHFKVPSVWVVDAQSARFWRLTSLRSEKDTSLNYVRHCAG